MMKTKQEDVNGDLSDRPRKKSFTPNWQQTLSRTVGLPVKFAGKVVSVYKDAVKEVESDRESEEIVLKRKSSKMDAKNLDPNGINFLIYPYLSS